jgi:dihydroxy-acid dehydratase
MLNDRYGGERVGAGTHTRKFFDEYVAGNLGRDEWIRLEAKMTRSPGTCNTMGTASTMTAIAEAMGFTLPGASSIPAMDANHPRMARACGARIVEMVWEDLTPARVCTAEAVANGVACYMALGGSTNAAIHTIAIAARAGVALSLDDLDAASRRIPVLANLFPSGDKLMEDFYYAGGLPALLAGIRQHLALRALTVNGRTLGENIAEARVEDAEVIRPADRPVSSGGTLALLKGNLCPDGAVVKASAASPRFARHRGRALVFDSHAEMSARIHDPALDVDEDTVLVLRHAGPVGAPGMPEWGNLPIPKKLLERGVRDMVRISDARMSGTHYGTCVLHVAPESAVGGPLALVRTGDEIEIDVPARRIHLHVSDDELTRRRAAWTPPPRRYERSWTMLYQQHVTQANDGCDLDFLETRGARPVPEPDIY